jgi:hypothetical protein
MTSIKYDAEKGVLLANSSKDKGKEGVGGWRVDRRRVGKWRFWCWLDGYGVGGGDVFMAEGRG